MPSTEKIKHYITKKIASPWKRMLIIWCKYKIRLVHSQKRISSFSIPENVYVQNKSSMSCLFFLNKRKVLVKATNIPLAIPCLSSRAHQGTYPTKLCHPRECL